MDMRRRVRTDDDWDDDEWDDEEGVDTEEDEPTVPCPYCRCEIHEDAPQCPYCGQYISEEDAPASRKPWWIVIGVLLSLCAIWVWFHLW
jgi:hypothetical protein